MINERPWRWPQKYKEIYCVLTLVIIMKGVLILLLFWKPYLAEGNANSYEAYYNEDFYSFVVQANAIQHKSIVQGLFSNLMRDNSTDSCLRDLRYYQDSVNSHEHWAISRKVSAYYKFYV
ncbi:unnamed protein product [Nezara viridula]|uniref:Uncharacterized protein n=1 Tax=Nezara viridula TaxID=85310 RepID=A0A9P0E7G1_NEZVI|nr:unnamed protein product [Nezara viridula]